jgi:polar amino acid transport system permease protein
MDVFRIIAQYREGLLGGLQVTLSLCLIVWSVGILLGSALGLLGARHPFTVGRCGKASSFIISGIPVLVLLFWLHYPVQAMLHVVINPFVTAAFALSIINTIAVGDTVRDAVQRFPAELVMAGQVCGLSTRDIVRHIQAPLLVRQIAPTLLMIQVNMLQATLFASLISVDEIFRVAQRINAVEYKPVEVYSALAAFFLAICLPLNGIALMLRHRYGRDLSER